MFGHSTEELFYKFNDVKYYDEPHKYYLTDGRKLTSVTTLLHDYVEEFDGDYWGGIKANQYSITEKQVHYAWEFINEYATTLGSIAHDYAENLFLNKVFPYPKDRVVDLFGYNAIQKDYKKTESHIDNFYNTVKNVLVPIKTELVVFDEESLVGGMVDLIFYNRKSKKIEIWDWKTNSANDAFNEKYIHQLKNELCLLTDKAIDIYSLQLSIYKYIIEKNTNLKLGDSYLVWISHKNENYEVKKCEDYTYYAEMLLNNRIGA